MDTDMRFIVKVISATTFALNSMAVLLHIKLYKGRTIEVYILTLNCLCLGFLMWTVAENKIGFLVAVIGTSGIVACFAWKKWELFCMSQDEKTIRAFKKHKDISKNV